MDLRNRGIQIKRKALFEFWRSVPVKGRLSKVIDFVKTKFSILVITEEQNIQLRGFLKLECEKIRSKWDRKQRRLDLFLKEYEEWLDQDLVFKMLSISPESGSRKGRPEKSFEQSSSRTRKRKIQHLLSDYSKDQLAYAAQVSVRACGKRDAAELIKEVSMASPRRATSYKKARRIINNKNKRKPYSPKEALAFFISNNLTVHTYKNIQQETKDRGFHAYPCYDYVAKVKEQCYPPVEYITVTDISAEVKLSALLDHTASRICKNILGEVMDTRVLNYTLIYKWGCDGSGGHSLYKQPFEDPDNTDEYMFILSLVPIRLEDNIHKIVWENPRPSSPRFCRIIKFIYKKETEQLIKAECKSIENQMQELMPTSIDIKGTNIYVSHKLILSMIDGKVCNALAENKSTQTCYICKATAKDMNRSITREPHENMYEFGISNLHAYIRSMECLLNISYRANIREWQVRGNLNKEIFKILKIEKKT